jgi:hypothetical protein
MNDILENRLSMYMAVQTFYTENQAAIDAVPALPPLFTQFNTHVTKIVDFAGPASADITGSAVDKKDKRVALTSAILKVCDAFSAWCYNNGDNTKAELFDETQASLDRMRDTALYTFAKNLELEADPVVLDLADYMVVPADITALADAAAAFLVFLKQPKYKRSERSAKLRHMTLEFKLASDLLNDKLDKSMKVFNSIDPVLYTTYQIVRKIDDTGAQSPPDFEGIVSPGMIEVAVNLPYSGGRLFKVKNIGSQNFTFALSTNDTTMEGEIVTVEPGQERQRLSSALNDVPNADFLLIENASGVNASYEVRIEE